MDFKPEGREVILNQPLVFNKHIVNNGREIFLKKWWQVGILRVRDVLYEIREGFLPVQAVIDELEEFKEEYDLSIKKQYEELKSAMPKEWLNEMQKEEKKEGKVEVYFTNQDKWMELRSGNVKKKF